MLNDNPTVEGPREMPEAAINLWYYVDEGRATRQEG